ncbi:MAG: D-aminoacylase [Bacteroidota bacterium]
MISFPEVTNFIKMIKNLPYLCFIFLIYSCSNPKTNVDLILTGGNVFDGSGTTPIQKTVVVRNDSIVDLINTWEEKYTCKKVIDVSGYTVSPGFIDPHTHAFDDLSSKGKNANLNFLMQGVTTVVTGNDGGGPVKIAEVFEKWETQGIGINAGLLVGHGTVRRLAMGMRDKKPNEEELETMKAFVKSAMEEGALGLSSGLYYAPGSYAETAEVIALAKVAAEYQGIYDTHLRDESSYNIGLEAAVKEAVIIATKAAIPLHISHIKCLGADVWGKSKQIISFIDSCRNTGLNITANQYPYRASGTNVISALFPRWSQAGGPDVFLDRLQDAPTRSKIYAAITENIRKRGGTTSLLITRYEDHIIVGLNLQQVAINWQLSPEDAALKIAENGNARLASFNMQATDIKNFMQKKWVVSGSDGSTGHPRKYGTFPRKLQKYVLEEKILSLEEFIHRSSALTAEIFGISNRGQIKKGYKADLIVFKPENFKEKADFQQPEQYAEGIHLLVLNGKIVIENGIYTGELAGAIIRNQQLKKID